MANSHNKKTAAKNKSASNSKASSKSKGSSSKKTSQSISLQTYAVILFAIALFLAAVVFIEGESVWMSMHNGMFALFGFFAWVLPAVLIYTVVILAMDKPFSSIAKNLLTGELFYIIVCKASKPRVHHAL